MPKNSSFAFFLLLPLFFVTGCVSGAKLEELTYSLDEIRSAIKGVSGEFRSVDSLRRRFESVYFAKEPQPNFDPETTSPRYYAKFFIAGDRRPYTVVVQVIEERKTRSGWVEVGKDQKLADRLAQDLKKTLAEGRVFRSVIDSFRPF